MHGSNRARLSLHHLQVHEDFAGALLRARQLVALQVHQAHVLRLHEALGDQGGGAEDDIFADANGDVAAVAVYVGALPEPAANLADLQLQLMDVRGVEEGL